MIVDDGDGGPRLLSYCTNVHPGETVDAILRGLTLHSVALRKRFPEQELFAIGLRLGEQAVNELDREPEALERLSGFLAEHGLAAFSVNAFPQGDFHAPRVKEQVYDPPWWQESRRDYTLRTARLLSQLLPPALNFGTVSTLPLGFGSCDAHQRQAGVSHLLSLTGSLANLEASTGNRIQVCLEPEPCCLLETSPQMVDFFEQELLPRADELEAVDGKRGEEQIRRHLGVCYDTCHQAVAFEEASYNFERFKRAGIEVGKIQLSSAVELRRPHENPDGVAQLRRFQESRYLHQVVTRSQEAGTERFLDLDRFLSALEAGALPEITAARCHFHVPIHHADAFPLGTTQAHLREVLQRQRATREVLHLEVETYTLDLLPDGPSGPAELVDDLESEIRFAQAHLTGDASGS